MVYVLWYYVRSDPPTPYGRRILEPYPVPKSFPLWTKSGFAARGKKIPPHNRIYRSSNVILNYILLPRYLLDPPSNPYDSPGSCSPSSQTYIPHNFFQRFSLAVKPTANRSQRKFIFFLWHSVSYSGSQTTSLICTKGGVASHSHLGA